VGGAIDKTRLENEAKLHEDFDELVVAMLRHRVRKRSID
jgi:hypothetical protein